jgi:hypothetical protein
MYIKTKIAVPLTAVIAKKMSIVLDLKNFTRKIRWLVMMKIA